MATQPVVFLLFHVAQTNTTNKGTLLLLLVAVVLVLLLIRLLLLPVATELSSCFLVRMWSVSTIV